MSTEQSTIEQDHQAAAFLAGYKGEALPATEPAAQEDAAPAPQGEAAATADAPNEVDEYAGLSPKVREQLQQLEPLRQAASTIPELAQRLRTAEGRVAALQKSVPVAPPPAPQRLEKVERIREDWPEVVDAMEEMLQSRAPKAEEQPAETPKAQAQDDDLPTPLLDSEMPDWGAKLTGPQFQTWLASQGPDYQRKVKLADSEGVVLAALTKFDAHQDLARARAAAAAKAVDTRTARASAAVTPVTAGRREPATNTEEQAFMAGYKRRRN